MWDHLGIYRGAEFQSRTRNQIARAAVSARRGYQSEVHVKQDVLNYFQPEIVYISNLEEYAKMDTYKHAEAGLIIREVLWTVIENGASFAGGMRDRCLLASFVMMGLSTGVLARSQFRHARSKDDSRDTGLAVVTE